jgi:hypothetical protein
MTFGFCRRESRGKPCRLILGCWRDQFDVLSFLQAHLPKADLAHLARHDDSPGT